MMIPLKFADKVFAFNLVGQAPPLAPGLLAKYVDRLPTLGVINATGGAAWSVYDIEAKPTSVVVSSGMAALVNPARQAAGKPVYAGTSFWSYRAAGATQAQVTLGIGNTYLGPAFVVKKGTPIKIRWHNNLVDAAGAPIPHPLAVDPSLHWAAADPPQTSFGTLTTAQGTVALQNMMPGPYTDPLTGLPSWVNPNTGTVDADVVLKQVPLVAHVHGGEQPGGSDGGPDGWITPNGITGPTWANVGDMQGPTATFEHALNPYWNTQPSASTWYHDHALGLTRLNVYMGLASGYLIVDPANDPTGLPGGNDSFGNPKDMALVIQDRMFDQFGELYYPALTLNPVDHPFWVPEFFGDTMLVNGKVWPVLDVDPAAYRFRLYNGSNARFYELSLGNKAASLNGPTFSQIATDGGYLHRPVTLSKLTVAPGERAEVVVDFSKFPGKKLILQNSAKAPYPKGTAPNPQTTGEVMMFRVRNATGTPYAFPTNPLNPSLATFAASGVPTLGTVPSAAPAPVGQVRVLTLNEYMGPGGPLEVVLNLTKWMAPVTENPTVGATEIWKIVNMTADTHPIHLHLVQFQLVSRQAFNTSTYAKAFTAANGMMPKMDASYVPVDPTPYLQGKVQLPPANERGWKDTVRMNPGEVTTIVVRFATIDPNVNTADPAQYPFPFNATAEPGYVWHCHIIDHEDNEMMRPYKVKP